MTRLTTNGALSANVLVLNRFYMAVHVVNVRRAFGLLFCEHAEVIHQEEGQFANYDFHTWREVSELKSTSKQPQEDWIRAINFEIQVPRVIRLFLYDRVPNRALRFNRRNLLARDNNCCQYCGRHFPTIQLSLDHVVPRSRGGATNWENVVCSCISCNVKKGGNTPKEARMKLNRKPAKPKHSPLLAMKLGNPKYESWKTFLNTSQWAVELS